MQKLHDGDRLKIAQKVILRIVTKLFEEYLSNFYLWKTRFFLWKIFCGKLCGKPVENSTETVENFNSTNALWKTRPLFPQVFHRHDVTQNQLG
jgi:hypothetical protein